jgi:hypothetical protein
MGFWTGECPEWQRELTVNQPSYDFEGSSPSSPTNLFNDLRSRLVNRPAFACAGIDVAEHAAPGGIGPPFGAPAKAPDLRGLAPRLQAWPRALVGIGKILSVLPMLSSGAPRSSRVAAFRNSLFKPTLPVGRRSVSTTTLTCTAAGSPSPPAADGRCPERR